MFWSWAFTLSYSVIVFFVSVVSGIHKRHYFWSNPGALPGTFSLPVSNTLFWTSTTGALCLPIFLHNEEHLYIWPQKCGWYINCPWVHSKAQRFNVTWAECSKDFYTENEFVKEGFSYPWKVGQHVGSKLSTSKSQLHCYLISVWGQSNLSYRELAWALESRQIYFSNILSRKYPHYVNTWRCYSWPDCRYF